MENLFDIQDDTTKNDDEFTPQGVNHWTARRYRTKMQHICQTLVALGDSDGQKLNMPVVVGLAEVENDRVLRDLCLGTALRRFGYDFIHFDSPDARGIDNALLYRRKYFKPYYKRAVTVCNSGQDCRTRDLLWVEGTLNSGDTLMLLICHLPSKRGGAVADQQRAQIACHMRSIMDSCHEAHPTAAIVVMGDFNSEPFELQEILTPKDNNTFFNLMANNPSGCGSYCFQGYWSWIDQIIVSTNLVVRERAGGLMSLHHEGQSFDADFLMTENKQLLLRLPYRTYQGPRYIGGYSDHLPVYIDLRLCER